MSPESSPTSGDVDVEGGRHPTGPAGQDDDTITQAHRLADVVGNEDHREVGLGPDALQLVVEEVPGDGVESPEGLVHEQDGTILGEGAGQRDPLAHAPGQLVGPLRSRAVETDEVEKSGDPLLALGPGHATEAEGEVDVALDGEPREQRRVLKHQRRLAGRPLDRPGGR